MKMVYGRDIWDGLRWGRGEGDFHFTMQFSRGKLYGHSITLWIVGLFVFSFFFFGWTVNNWQYCKNSFCFCLFYVAMKWYKLHFVLTSSLGNVNVQLGVCFLRLLDFCFEIDQNVEKSKKLFPFRIKIVTVEHTTYALQASNNSSAWKCGFKVHFPSALPDRIHLDPTVPMVVVPEGPVCTKRSSPLTWRLSCRALS